jgi:ABC transporter substrate binding protein
MSEFLRDLGLIIFATGALVVFGLRRISHRHLSLPNATLALRKEVVDLTARHRLPAMYWDASFVKLGGLAFYGVDRVDLFRRSAAYVDRILRGEKAADLPFQLSPRLCGTPLKSRNSRIWMEQIGAKLNCNSTAQPNGTSSACATGVG